MRWGVKKKLLQKFLKKKHSHPICHPRESGDPVGEKMQTNFFRKPGIIGNSQKLFVFNQDLFWIPAFAGMTAMGWL